MERGTLPMPAFLPRESHGQRSQVGYSPQGPKCWTGPITSWEIDGETVETVADFILGGSKSLDGDCSHEINRHLFLGRKVMTNPDSILKSRDSALPTKVRLAKAMVFPVVCMDEKGDGK